MWKRPRGHRGGPGGARDHRHRLHGPPPRRSGTRPPRRPRTRRRSARSTRPSRPGSPASPPRRATPTGCGGRRRAWGDLTTGAPRGKNDRFRVANLTDTFVATVILQMVAERKLGLDDSVERHLPGLVSGNGNDGSRITVRQLLNHTSGLFDYLADTDFAETYLMGDGYLQHRYDTLTPEGRVRVALAHEPLFEPGARHGFSHTNDVPAALLVEKIGGRPYADEVRRRIIEPLGLTATSNPGTAVGLPPAERPRLLQAVRRAAGPIDDVTEVNASQIWGNGDIISSTADLNRFYGALMRGKLFPAQQLGAAADDGRQPGFPARPTVSASSGSRWAAAPPSGTTTAARSGGSPWPR
ncbi:serine hydrolase domain-containing protein [Streptomyces sp. KL116D]|uniref:serine hydrolase domain-containing protein n=1 Tax=Streptomyces sp. KL116D TaxID=3045152 RepID=UPI0035572A00